MAWSCRASAAFLALLVLMGVEAPVASAQEKSSTPDTVPVIHTFATTTPAQPIDIGGGRDLAVNHDLTTSMNEAGRGFLHLTAGRRTAIWSVLRAKKSIDPTDHCRFKDHAGDRLCVDYATGGGKLANAITIDWTFTSGIGMHDGIQRTAHATNSNNIDDQGAYQAAGKLTGSPKIVRSKAASDPGLDDPYQSDPSSSPK